MTSYRRTFRKALSKPSLMIKSEKERGGQIVRIGCEGRDEDSVCCRGRFLYLLLLQLPCECSVHCTRNGSRSVLHGFLSFRRSALLRPSSQPWQKQLPSCMQDGCRDVAAALCFLLSYASSCSSLLWWVIIHVSLHFRLIFFSPLLRLAKGLDSDLEIWNRHALCNCVRLLYVPHC